MQHQKLPRNAFKATPAQIGAQFAHSIYPVILSGGSGTRLWPLSRAMYPKQFIRFSRNQPCSFLTATLNRLPASAGFSAPIIIGSNDHRFLIEEEAARAGVSPLAVILEPVARNTAAAIAVTALYVARQDPTGVLVVMPSDHVIKDEPGFVEAVRRAVKISASGKFTLFGITPESAHTGYGYIRRGTPLPGFDGAYGVASFAEKPDKSTAERYVATDEYSWNSGIFVLGARAFIEELARLEPDILKAAGEALTNAKEDLGFLRLDSKAFASAPAMSVDHAVMERTGTAAVLPLDIGWNDIGSWSSLWELASHDEHGNAVEGDALLESTSDCYIYSERSLVATIGVKDLVIVETPDALLVADKSKAQDVSRIVASLGRSKRKERERHLRSYRPWGYFETLSLGSRFQVKLLHVKPGGKLSMQMHHHRSEHWIVVHGTARVTIGNDDKLVRENESVYISATQWHRVENPGKTPLEMIEVQTGSYLGEDDIVRTDDVYNRAPEETK
jgi:mannose-1-phosphate guanylyltransferase/mannose-6-phosphate isomerase